MMKRKSPVAHKRKLSSGKTVRVKGRHSVTAAAKKSAIPSRESLHAKMKSLGAEQMQLHHKFDEATRNRDKKGMSQHRKAIRDNVKQMSKVTKLQDKHYPATKQKTIY